MWCHTYVLYGCWYCNSREATNKCIFWGYRTEETFVCLTLTELFSLILIYEYFTSRREENSDIHAMGICTFFHALLFTFELLLCLNINGSTTLPYRAIFAPLFCISALSIGGCVWGFKHDRSLEVWLKGFLIWYSLDLWSFESRAKYDNRFCSFPSSKMDIKSYQFLSSIKAVKCFFFNFWDDGSHYGFKCSRFQ